MLEVVEEHWLEREYKEVIWTDYKVTLLWMSIIDPWIYFLAHETDIGTYHCIEEHSKQDNTIPKTELLWSSRIVQIGCPQCIFELVLVIFLDLTLVRDWIHIWSYKSRTYHQCFHPSCRIGSIFASGKVLREP